MSPLSSECKPQPDSGLGETPGAAWGEAWGGKAETGAGDPLLGELVGLWPGLPEDTRAALVALARAARAVGW